MSAVKTRSKGGRRPSAGKGGKPGPRLVADNTRSPLPAKASPKHLPRQVEDGVVLTPEQLRRRRARNIAIALTLGFLALLFYAVTIVKLGPNVLNRPL